MTKYRHLEKLKLENYPRVTLEKARELQVEQISGFNIKQCLPPSIICTVK